MPHGGVLSADPLVKGVPIEPSSLILQSPEAGMVSASAVPGFRCRATGLAVVSAHTPAFGSSARTLTSLKVALSSQTQVGTFTVDLTVGFNSISVDGTSILSYA